MKKILFYLLMPVTLQMSAQSTTYFSKPLELERVPASTSKSDSVLVRGTDKIMKFVPRSEFGGSAKTFDEVLGAGPIATDKAAIWRYSPEGGAGASGVTAIGPMLVQLQDQTKVPDSVKTATIDPTGINIQGLSNNAYASDLKWDRLMFSNRSLADNSDTFTFIHTREDNGTDPVQTVVKLPKNTGEYYLPLTINGYPADRTGNIEISGGGSQDLQSVLNTGMGGYVNGDYNISLNNGDYPNTKSLLLNPNNLDISYNSQTQALLYQGSDSGAGTINKYYGALALSIADFPADEFGNFPNRRSSILLANPDSEENTSGGINYGKYFLPVNDNSNTIKTLATEDQITLQKAVDNNNIIDDNSSIICGEGDITTNIYSEGVTLSNASTTRDITLGIDTNSSKAYVLEYIDPNGLNPDKRIILEFYKELEGINRFKFPEKPDGEYTLATEDILTLQGTLTNGTNASFDGGDNTADILTTLSGTRKRVTFVTSTTGFGTSQFSVHDQLAIISNDTGSNIRGSFSVANGLSKIQQDNGSAGTTVQFNTPTSNSTVNFPAPSVSGDYDLATTVDLPVMTTRNTAPSSATATGVKGDIRIDDNYIYLCVATNTWKRSPLSTW